jgi:hypothetical protein
LQTVEDRFVFVRARSEEDAARRVETKWRRHEEPYLNSSGELVRWHVEEITAVYDPREQTIDPSGTEIYSELRSRRMKPGHAWSPCK